jgi:hypothetical protein
MAQVEGNKLAAISLAQKLASELVDLGGHREGAKTMPGEPEPQPERRETFIVVEMGGRANSHSVTLLGGQKVNALNRSVFEKAVKAAFKHSRGK